MTLSNDNTNTKTPNLNEATHNYILSFSHGRAISRMCSSIVKSFQFNTVVSSLDIFFDMCVELFECIFLNRI